MYETCSRPPRTRTTPRVRVVFPAAESPTTPRTTGRVIRGRMSDALPAAERLPSARCGVLSHPDRRPRAVLALLDQLDLGEQVLRHAQRGRVDQPAVEGDRTLARMGGLFHRRHDPPGPGDQALVGGEDFVSELDLARVDAPLALEAEDRGTPR